MKENKQLEKIIRDVLPSINSNSKTTKSDIYFNLKNYCIENLILLNKESREFCLKELSKRIKVKKNNKSVFDYNSPGKIKGLVRSAHYKDMNIDSNDAEYVLETKTKLICIIVKEKEQEE